MFEAIVTLTITATLLLGSPGPAPLALAASGATFGVRPSLPFLAGILLGILSAIVVVASGLSVMPETNETLRLTMQIVCSLYFLFIAYKIASAPFNDMGMKSHHVPSFTSGFLLNLLNPKAYAAFVALFSQLLIPAANEWWSLFLTGAVCFVVAVFVDVVWLAMGGVMQPLFNTPRKARVFRVVLATLLLASVVWAFYF